MKKEISAQVVWAIIASLVLVMLAVAYMVFREPPRPGPDDRPNPPAPLAPPGGGRPG